MPLLDHFAPPLDTGWFWHSFHNVWASAIAAHLNEQLPPNYRATPNVQFGIEIEVAAFEVASAASTGIAASEASVAWPIPEPVQTIPFVATTDIIEIQLIYTRGGPRLVGAIELVSPANKDRPASREAFTAKCQAYLQQGISLAIVDLVTSRTANLHEELLVRIRHDDDPAWEPPLYATSYRPIRRNSETFLDIWRNELILGQTLPSMPLWLRDAICLRVDLESSYVRACREQRIELPGTKP
jgi:Protein of unknown function (DUF4058)